MIGSGKCCERQRNKKAMVDTMALQIIYYY